jgi:molybdopterin synthase catalytic subunit
MVTTATLLPSALRMQWAPLDLDAVYQAADDPANGSVVLMVGTVRNNTSGRPVLFLEYEAYETMALKVFQDIAQKAQHQWSGINQVVIHHRVGKLMIGEISVAVAVGSAHRAEGFLACQFAIDTLKHTAPIWKKEHWADGSSEWVSLAACDTTH